MGSGGYESEAHRKAMLGAAGLPGTAITQTYATAATTHPAVTSSPPAALTFGTNVTAKTPASLLTDAVNTNAGTVATSLDQAQADLGAKINALRTDLIATQSDLLAAKKLLNQVIDDLQAFGIEA